MSFPDPRPSFMIEQSFSSSDALWHQFSMTNEQPDPYSQPEYPQPPPFKRPRNFEDNQSNAIPYPHMNSSVQQPIPPVNRTGNIFFKTRMCIKFRQGMCPNGENCNFAHGVEDMRQPPPNWQELVGVREDVRGNANWDDEQRIIQMRKICKKFYNGEECPYGARCNFLHEKREDLGRVRESSVISIGTAGPPLGHGGASDQPDGNRAANYGLDPCRMNGKPIYWKTRLCVKWETTGLCPFGEKCHFAHGQAELQLPGGRTDVELVNTVSIPVNPIPFVSNDVPLSTTLTEVTSNHEEPEKKSLLKWKGPKKINRIYADWIDDLPLLAQSLPAKVES